MKFLLLLVTNAVWGIQAQDGFNITFRLDSPRSATFDWRIKRDDRTDLKCDLKCDLAENNVKDLLYIGTIDKTIDVYDWRNDTQTFVKNSRGTMKTYGIPWLFLMDTSRNRLITMENKFEGVGEILESFDLRTSPGFRVSWQGDAIFFNGTALHSSGKFLLTSEFNPPGRMFALELKDNDLLAISAMFTPPKPAQGFIQHIFHPKAHDVLAAIYPNLKMIKFLRFNAKEKTITSIVDVKEKVKPNSLIFSSDGNYMYVTNYLFKISTYKVDVSYFTVRVEPQSGSANIVRPGDEPTEYPFDLMALSPSQKYLYAIPFCHNYMAMFSISSSTHQPLPNGFKATGGSCSHSLAIAPDGSRLLVQEQDKEILIFNIRADGTLEEAGKIEGVINPTAMLYITK